MTDVKIRMPKTSAITKLGINKKGAKFQ